MAMIAATEKQQNVLAMISATEKNQTSWSCFPQQTPMSQTQVTHQQRIILKQYYIAAPPNDVMLSATNAREPR